MRYDSSVEMAGGRVKAKRGEPSVTFTKAALTFILSLGSGFTVYVGVGMVGWGFGWDSAPAKVASGVAVLVVWGWFLFQYVPDLLWTIERVTKRDINRDGYTGRPTIVQYELQPTNNTLWRGDFMVNPHVLREWCMAARNGRSLAYNQWVDLFALPDGTRGREQYAKFRRALISQEMVREIGGNVGIELTGKGWMFIDSFLASDEGTTLLGAEEAETGEE